MEANIINHPAAEGDPSILFKNNVKAFFCIVKMMWILPISCSKPFL